MQLVANTASIAPTRNKPAVTVDEQQPRTEAKAADAMWLYYRDHKDQLLIDIKEYRDGILAKLVAGEPVEQVFAPYARPPMAPAGRPKK